MANRYFVETSIVGDRAVLVGAEAHHLAHVMRGRQGDRVTLFDGSGAEFVAEVTGLRRDEVELKVVARDEVDRELPFRLTLAVALPKGDRQRWLVEKAVELGVGRIMPLRTASSVAQPEANALRRMARWVIDASKQCGRNRLMEIAQAVSWPELLAESAAIPLRLLAHPSTGDGASESTSGCQGPSAALAQSTTSETIAAIGPEGGWTDEEIAAARRAGWQTVDLGSRTLRVETAAVFLAAMLVVGHGR